MATHMQVAHRWAQGVYRGARTASGIPEDTAGWPRGLKGFNMYSEGPTLYSYGTHFPLARIVETPNAGTVIVFNDESRSISTSKHQTYTRRAIPAGVQVFDVGDAIHYFMGYPDAETHRRVLSMYEAKAEKEQGAASRARLYVQSHLDRAQRFLNEAQAYADAFGVEWERPALADLSARAAEAAKREREARAAAEAARKAAEEAAKVRDAGAFEAWRSGASGSRCPYSYSRTATGGAYLRRSPDGESLETSQGAAVPWEHALKAFRFVKLVRERGEPWQRNGRQVRVGHYQLDRIEASGDFRAGCHLIEWAEIERLAKAEGVFDAAPSAEAQTESGH